MCVWVPVGSKQGRGHFFWPAKVILSLCTTTRYLTAGRVLGRWKQRRGRRKGDDLEWREEKIQTIVNHVLCEIKKFIQNVRFEVFKAVKFHIVILCIRASCSLVGGYKACRRCLFVSSGCASCIMFRNKHTNVSVLSSANLTSQTTPWNCVKFSIRGY
jgi:hypothetical protein